MTPETISPLTLLLAAVSALAGCVVFLYAQARDVYAQCMARETKCEEKHDALLIRVVAVETERRIYGDVERRVAALLAKTGPG